MAVQTLININEFMHWLHCQSDAGWHWVLLGIAHPHTNSQRTASKCGCSRSLWCICGGRSRGRRRPGRLFLARELAAPRPLGG